MKAIGRDFLKGNFFDKRVYRHPGVRPCPAASGQRVVGARGVIASTFGGVGAEKHGASIDHLQGPVPWILHLKDEVFRRIGIRPLHGFIKRGQYDGLAVLKRLPRDVAPGQFFQLQVHFCLHLVDQVRAVAEQDDLAIWPVLGLAEQVGCYKRRICRMIGHNRHFGRPGRHVYGHAFQRDELFGGGHPGVAGTKNLIDGCDTRQPICHGTNGLYASKPVYLLNAAKLSSVQHRRVRVAIGSGRGTQHHVSATCYLCGHAQHKHSGKQGRGTARDVQAHALDGHSASPATHARHGFHC